MRLIDADKLIEVLNKKSVPFNAIVNDAILTAPTVDAVDRELYEQCKFDKDIAEEQLKKIVRCKDCKHRDKCHKKISIRGYDKDIECNYARFERIDYCSYGEMEDDGSNILQSDK